MTDIWDSLLEQTDSVVLDQLGKDVTYWPKDGAPIAVRAIFERPFSTADVGRAGVGGSSPYLFLRRAALASKPVEGDRVLIPNDATGTGYYRVIDPIEPDGQGGLRLPLHMQNPPQVTGRLAAIAPAATCSFTVKIIEGSLDPVAPSATCSFTGVAYSPFLLDNDFAAGAILAWSTGRRLRQAYGGNNADLPAGVLTKIYDQIGARDATPAGAPAQGVGTINGNPFVKFDGVDDKLTFPSLALGAGDWEIHMCFGIDGSNANTGALFGRLSNTGGMRGTATNNFDWRSDSAGPQNYSTVWATVPGFHHYRFKRTGGNVYIYTDGEQIGAPFGRAIAGNFTFDEFGASGAATAFTKIGLGEVVIFNRVLTDPEAALVQANMQGAWPTGLYIDAATGNDANLGWNVSAPYATIGKVRPMIVRANQNLNITGTYRRDPLLWNVLNQQGAAGAPVKIKSYGVGATLIGSKLAAGPWTLTGGTEYQFAMALTSAQCVWAYDGGGNITRLTLGVAGALAVGQWAYAAGALHVNAGVNPAGLTIEVADLDAGTIPDDNGARPAKPYINVDGFELKHWPTDGLKFEGDNCRATNINTHHNANDGVGGSGANIYLGQFVSTYNGQGIATTGPAGDGASFHGGSIGTIEDGTIAFNDKAGIDHQETATVVHRRLVLDGNNQNILVANLAGVSGSQTFENCIIKRRAGTAARTVQAVNSAALSFNGCDFVGLESHVGSGVYHSATGQLTINNSIVRGFAIGIEQVGGAIAHDYNLFYDNTANFSGTAQGAHENVGADPLFTNFAGGDYHLAAGSPAIDAGIANGLVQDYDKRARSTPPDVGAFER